MTTDKAISSIMFFILPFNKKPVTITNKRVILQDFAIPIKNIEKIEKKGFFTPVYFLSSGYNFLLGRGLRIRFNTQGLPNPVNNLILATLESHLPDIGGHVILFTNPNKLIPIFQKLRPDIKIQSSPIFFYFLEIISIILVALGYLYYKFFPI